MHFMDAEDEDPNSWVSIKSLKEAAEVKSVYRSSRTSPVHSPESSVFHEPRPMSVYASNKPGREKIQSTSISFDYGAINASKVEELTNKRVSALEGDSGRLVDVVKMMHRQLTHDKAEIKGLKREIVVMQKEFAQQKLSLQSHWQRKLSKLDIDFEAQREAITRDWTEEKERLKNEYEERIESLKADHEIELQEKEEMWEAEMERLKAEPPPQPLPRAQDLEEKYKRVIESMEKRHIEEVAKLKASLPEKQFNPASFRKLPISTPKATEPAISPTSEIAEIESMKLINKELRRQLEEERQKYSDLQTHVQGSFRKKSQRSLAQTLDPSETSRRQPELLEGEIKSLIGQINTHLENSDLFNSSYTLADSLRNICLKIDQLSSSSFIQL